MGHVQDSSGVPPQDQGAYKPGTNNRPEMPRYLEELKKLVSPDTYTGKVFAKHGMYGLLHYLSRPQVYRIVTTDAFTSFDSYFAGKLGQHAVIILPGARQCERFAISIGQKQVDLDKEVRQEEWRMAANGRVIEKMWNRHVELIIKYNEMGYPFDGKEETMVHYMPFVNDCFTYVNRVLTESGEKETLLRREAQSIVGIFTRYIRTEPPFPDGDSGLQEAA